MGKLIILWNTIKPINSMLFVCTKLKRQNGIRYAHLGFIVAVTRHAEAVFLNRHYTFCLASVQKLFC